jgi:hypothetical protein
VPSPSHLLGIPIPNSAFRCYLNVETSSLPIFENRANVDIDKTKLINADNHLSGFPTNAISLDDRH